MKSRNCHLYLAKDRVPDQFAHTRASGITMKKTLLAITSIVTALVLPGCFQSETTIHLNKDGSGKLVEETKFGAQMVAMMEQMAAMGGEDAKKENPMKEMISEEKAKARLKDLGEGVTFEKVEPLDANGSKGARVTYAFKDINKLKVSAGDGMKAMGDMPGAEAAEKPKEEPVGFTYANGKLVVKMPQPKKADAPAKEADEGAAEPDMDSPEAMAMMKQIMGDMKMSLKLVIEPGIDESNATHKDGNTITLMEMDMSKLVQNEAAMKKLAKMGKEKDPKAAMEALKGVEGIKVETNEEVTVKVK